MFIHGCFIDQITNLTNMGHKINNQIISFNFSDTIVYLLFKLDNYSKKTRTFS